MSDSSETKKRRSHEFDDVGTLVPDMRLLTRSVHKKAKVSMEAAVTLSRMAMALYEQIEPRARVVRERMGRITLEDSDIIEAAKYLMPAEMHSNGMETYKEALEKRKIRSAERKLANQVKLIPAMSLSAQIRSGAVVEATKKVEAEA